MVYWKQKDLPLSQTFSALQLMSDPALIHLPNRFAERLYFILLCILKSKIEVVQPLAESKKNAKKCSSAATMAATLEP
jgi:hypothetical protein